MAACLSGRYQPSYSPFIFNHGPQLRGILETLAFCIVKLCQNPHNAVKPPPFPPCRLYFHYTAFLAHLSRRLIGELIGYPWSGVRPSSVVRPSVVVVVNNFKHLLLRNRWADQSQILCGASLGRGNDILFAASGSHDQDGRHAHIW